MENGFAQRSFYSYTGLKFSLLIHRGAAMNESAIAELLDRQEITRLLHQVARATDRGDQQLFSDAYHDDGQDFHGVANGHVSGIVAALGSMNNWCVASHHSITNIDIQINGDTADVESYFRAFHRRSDETGDWDELLLGRYVDRFERRSAVWKIAKRICIFDWSSIEPGNQTPWTAAYAGEYVFGQRNRQDSYYTKDHPSS